MDLPFGKILFVQTSAQRSTGPLLSSLVVKAMVMIDMTTMMLTMIILITMITSSSGLLCACVNDTKFHKRECRMHAVKNRSASQSTSSFLTQPAPCETLCPLS